MLVHTSTTWQIQWAGQIWALLPNTPVTIKSRSQVMSAAKIEFPNPSPIGEPRVIVAVVPVDDLEAHTV